jgi:hypothetical protein
VVQAGGNTAVSAGQIAPAEDTRRQINARNAPKDWNVKFDPVTGRPLAPLDGQGRGSGIGAGNGEGLVVNKEPMGSLMGRSGSRKGTDKGGKEPPPAPPKAPQVWHRDASRPTFARVYVGDNNSLELVSLHVTVTVEGPRARTLVDHVFRNPHDRQLEGTFEYPLPAGASPSYFAMFLGQTRDTAPPLFARRGDTLPLPEAALARLSPSEIVKQVNTTDWGNLQEAHVVSKEKALETYEETVRGRIDPALLEYAGGNTFSGRVFPIPPKGYNRVLIAYEELLPVTGDQLVYRFPLPGRKLPEMRFTLSADAKECLKPTFQPKDAAKEESGGRVTFARTWSNALPEGDAVFTCTLATPRVQAVSGRQGDNGPRYLYARLRPEVPALDKASGFAAHSRRLPAGHLAERAP